MNPRIREELDVDKFDSVKIPTRLRTDENTKFVTCSMCGDAYYVDEATFTSLSRAVGYDPDNRFMCPRCEEENAAESRR